MKQDRLNGQQQKSANSLFGRGVLAMFGRPKSVVPFTKPAIEQIADALQTAGYKGLISEDRTHVESATNGYNFKVKWNEENWSVQLSIGISNETIGYTFSDANEFNSKWRFAKVYMPTNLDSIWMDYDFYIIGGEIQVIFEKYLPLWTSFVVRFQQSLQEAETRHQAEQEKLKREPPQPGAITYQWAGRVSLAPLQRSRAGQKVLRCKSSCIAPSRHRVKADIMAPASRG
jgi:hypothetical protein